MKYNIKEGNYKNVTIKIVDSDTVSINKPYYLSNDNLNKIIKSKMDWINQKLKTFKNNDILKNRYDFQNYAYKNNIKYENIDNKKSFYKQNFDNYIKPLVKKWEKITKLHVKNILLMNSIRMWGNLNQNLIMRLNWKVSILPEYLIEYVIVHELCHSKEFNHSTKFWKLVEKILPDYKNRKVELNKYSFLLKSNVL